MKEHEKSLLEVFLKSQLQIENAVLEGLEPLGSGVINDTMRKVSYLKTREIKRQIIDLSNPKAHTSGLKLEEMA